MAASRIDSIVFCTPIFSIVSVASLIPAVSINLKIIAAANKIDLDKSEYYKKSFSEIENIIFISSSERTHFDELKNILYSSVIEKKASPESTIVSNVRHADALQNTHRALDEVLKGMDEKISSELLAVDIRRALDYLGEITGEITNENLLDEIFRKFCIGK
jgi:tRNA modification GTPase